MAVVLFSKGFWVPILPCFPNLVIVQLGIETNEGQQHIGLRVGMF
jgi:hypothetical protein